MGADGTGSERSGPRTAGVSASSRGLLGSIGFVTAAAVSTVAAVAAGLAPARDVSGGNTPSIGTSQLLQSEDLATVRLDAEHQQVGLGTESAFSRCSGQGASSWDQALPESAAPFSLSWSDASGSRVLNEVVSRTATSGQAKQVARRLAAVTITDCLQPSAHSAAGQLTSIRVGSGVASWAPAPTGSAAEAASRVAVIRKGRTVGYVELRGGDTSGTTLPVLARLATDRLH